MPVRTTHLIGRCTVMGAFLLAGCTGGRSDAPSDVATSARVPSTGVLSAGSSAPATSSSASRSTTSTSARPTSTTSRPTPAARLPLPYSTGSAEQVLTVVASSRSDTMATLQAWQRAGDGWQRVGPAVPAWLGRQGMTPKPSEQLSATPMGSFTVSQSFGHNGDPGTRLPYVQTTPADWWISEAGPLYNTMQRCSSQCSFGQGDPNEHLDYIRPFYDYAVVIDYNRAPVRQGAGSAFFLHVSVGAPTQGCVSIDRSQLIRIMQWLRPAAHPRIVIGTA